MKVKRLWLVVILAIISTGALLLILILKADVERHRGEAFCLGRLANLTAIEFTGQDRQATVKDREALTYFAALPKFGSLPIDTTFTNALSFDVRIEGEWFSSGIFTASLNSDGSVIKFSYFKSLWDDCSIAFSIIDSKAPQSLTETLTFLLDEGNRGRKMSKCS